MLMLQLRDGEYLTIGEDIVIQVFASSTVKLSVQAPKQMSILRGKVLERNGENRPDCVFDVRGYNTSKHEPANEVSNG